MLTENHSQPEEPSGDVGEVVNAAYEARRNPQDMTVRLILEHLTFLMRHWSKSRVNVVTYAGGVEGVPLNWAAEYLQRDLNLSTVKDGVTHKLSPTYYASVLISAELVKSCHPTSKSRTSYYVPLDFQSGN